MPIMAPRLTRGKQVAGDRHGAGARHHRHRHPDAARAHHVAGDGDVAQIFAPAGDDAGGLGVLDHIAGDRGVGLHADAEAFGLGRRARNARAHVAHDVAAHGREPAALLEIGDRDAGAGLVDHVVGDQRAFEIELGIDRDFVEPDAIIADDLDVGGGVAADRRKRRLADDVVAHDHVVGLEIR